MAIFKRMLSEIATSGGQGTSEKALEDYVKVSLGLFAPRFDEDFEVNVADKITC